mgnify:CR=1 FL=1
MVVNYVLGLVSVLMVSAISLLGATALSFKEKNLQKYVFVFVSLAVGSLLGDAFIHLIPEAIESSLDDVYIGLLVVLGIIAFFMVEKFLHWHHHGEDSGESHIHPVGRLIVFSDGVHNAIDGIVIGASFMVSIPVGIATTLAIILHEIPQEIGDFMVLLHAGYSKKRALLLNFISALFAVVGLVIIFLFNKISQDFTVWILPVTAGGFIYIAVADLIPELHKSKEAKHSIIQIISLILGVLLMLSLLLVE